MDTENVNVTVVAQGPVLPDSKRLLGELIPTIPLEPNAKMSKMHFA